MFVALFLPPTTYSQLPPRIIALRHNKQSLAIQYVLLDIPYSIESLSNGPIEILLEEFKFFSNFRHVGETDKLV